MDFLKSSINLPALSTGTSLMKMSGGLGNGATQMSSMESMKEVFLEIRDNTKETVELLKTMVLGDSTQDKKDAIGAGDTDKPPKEKGPGILSRVMGGLKGAFSSLMPEKGGFMDTLLKLGLAVGGVALLKYFGDDMVPILADLLKSIKEGKIGGKIKEAYEYIKDIGMDAFEKLKVNTVLFIDGVKKVAGLIMGVYNMVNDYVMSFDTKGAEHPAGAQHGTIDEGDGILDLDEQRKLKEDLAEKAKVAIGGFLEGVMDSFVGLMLTSTFAVFGAKQLLKSAAVQGIFFGGKGSKPPQGPSKKGPPIKGKGIGLGGVLGIAALLAFGITETFDNFKESMETSLKNTGGTFDFSDFISVFLGGKEKGGLMNAFAQAKKVGGTGALIGMSLGAFGGLPGIIFGGLLGLAGGALIGGLSGWLGSEKMKTIVDPFMMMVDGIVTTIGNFFTDIAGGFGSLIRGEGFMKGFKERELANTGGVLGNELSAIQSQIDSFKFLEKSQGVDLSAAIAELEVEKSNIEKKIAFAPAVQEGVDLRNLEDRETNLTEKITGIEGVIAKLDPNASTSADDRAMYANYLLQKNTDLSEKLGRFVSYAESLEIYKQMRNDVRAELKIASSNFTVEDQRAIQTSLGIGSGSEMSGPLIDFKDSFAGSRSSMVPISTILDAKKASGNVVIQDNSQKTASETNILGNLSQDNRHFTALALGYKQMKMQTN